MQTTLSPSPAKKPQDIGYEASDGTLYLGMNSSDDFVYVMPGDLYDPNSKSHLINYKRFPKRIEKLNKAKAFGHSDWDMPTGSVESKGNEQQLMLKAAHTLNDIFKFDTQQPYGSRSYLYYRGVSGLQLTDAARGQDVHVDCDCRWRPVRRSKKMII